MMEYDSFININSVCVNEDADVNTKKRLLHKNGATIIRNLDGSITATGLFSIYNQQNDDMGFIINSGNMHIRPGTTTILYGFNNLASGRLCIDFDALENMIFTMESNTQDQQTKQLSLGKLLLAAI